MNINEKNELLLIIQRSLVKLTECHSLIKDGKVVVAYEKLGGVIKIISALGSKIEKSADGVDFTSDHLLNA